MRKPTRKPCQARACMTQLARALWASDSPTPGNLSRALVVIIKHQQLFDTAYYPAGACRPRTRREGGC